MIEWSFRLVLAGVELTDADLDALYEAGCDDATFSRERDGSVFAIFDRETDSAEKAIISALDDVARAGVGARTLCVLSDEDWLTATEIAERVGRTRQSIGQLVRGERGPGGFPAPVARQGSTNPLWNWADVAGWFRGYDPGAVTQNSPGISPDFLAAVNDLLDLRERRRGNPDAPWWSALDEALPLVS